MSGMKPEPTDTQRLRHARKLIREAMIDIMQAKAAIHMPRELNDLRHIEDVLWQLTGDEKRGVTQ